MTIVDLTQRFENGMPGFRMRGKSGALTEFGASVRPFLTHRESLPNYDGKASFEITEVRFQTSIGTYLDAPRHRYEGGADIADLKLDSLILDCIVIDATFCTPERPLTPDHLPEAGELRGKAALIHFGWDRYWGSEDYYRHPFVSRDALDCLLRAGIGLFGVDALNADDRLDLERPAHTLFLRSGIHIVENLTGLDRLLGRESRFYAIPLPVRDAAAFPVRAFAELRD
jgi:kynurenine formamidase